MCVIIVKKEQGKLDQNIAAKALSYNPDGFGIQMLDSGEVFKTMNIAEAQDWLTSERPYVFHARLTTVGKTLLDNVHPVQINEHNWLFHNGTVQVPHTWSKDKSDTRFVADTLRKTPWQSWKDILSLTDSRFVYTRMSKKGKLYVNRIGRWHEQDGVLYSKSNVLEGKHLVAVYGTLRQGWSNHRLLESSKLVGAGQTIEQYAMVCEGIPFVLPGHREDGHNIQVEVYAVDDATLERLDRLENHPNWYERKDTKISLDNGLVINAQLYFNDVEVTNGMTFYADYEHYSKPPRSSLYTPTIFDDVEEHDKSTFNNGDFIWDQQEKLWYNMVSGEYWTDEEKDQYLDLFENQLSLF